MCEFFVQRDHKIMHIDDHFPSQRSVKGASIRNLTITLSIAEIRRRAKSFGELSYFTPEALPPGAGLDPIAMMVPLAAPLMPLMLLSQVGPSFVVRDLSNLVGHRCLHVVWYCRVGQVAFGYR